MISENISALMTLKCWLQQARFEDNKFVDNDDEFYIINEEAFESVGRDYDESQLMSISHGFGIEQWILFLKF